MLVKRLPRSAEFSRYPVIWGHDPKTQTIDFHTAISAPTDAVVFVLERIPASVVDHLRHPQGIPASERDYFKILVKEQIGYIRVDHCEPLEPKD